MIPFRTQVKFFVENPKSVDEAAFSRVFHTWIQQKALPGLLIDVADYRHVFEGPGIMLIGHESDYAMEKRGGRLGLLYTSKHQLESDLPTQLRNAFNLALMAGELLEADESLRPRLKFKADEIEIRFADRRQLPNRPESFELVRDDLRTVLTELYGTDQVEFAPVASDPRHLFMVAVHQPAATSIRDLFRQLQPNSEA